MQHLLKWVPCSTLDPQDINVVVTGKDDVSYGKVTIISYDLMSKSSKRIFSRGYKIVIMVRKQFVLSLNVSIECEQSAINNVVGHFNISHPYP